MIRIGVKVMPREVVLDTQGRAVERLLNQRKISVEACRVGRFVELTFQENNVDTAMSEARKIATEVLHNPLIETFELAVIS
jgi:phosphoribosylformylglycinamidine synthase subunit PurS